MKTWMVFADGRRVYVCDAKTKAAALSGAKGFLKSLGDDVSEMKWSVTEYDGRPLWR